ncbi:hypothetical protein [Cognatishimia sp. F0-27]|uniref:hypothetical protein n=1 Tax=Cognatishimia sp. F0-27 TaxID=2816855 RepID=UPI001D0C6486|nr:hypothetical protein [Cognatishimia sp. F0-27]MCC1491766.1 hypothetical protein [Cognatishimia sp. F0-27]
MHVPFVPMTLAPVTTGHPLGLPDPKRPRPATQRVEALRETDKSALADDALRDDRSPFPTAVRPDRQDTAPPPTRMQKEILNRLASRIAETDQSPHQRTVQALPDASQTANAEARSTAPQTLPAKAPLLDNRLPGYGDTRRINAGTNAAPPSTTATALPVTMAKPRETDGTNIARPYAHLPAELPNVQHWPARGIAPQEQ